jgi:hypothetical protein
VADPSTADTNLSDLLVRATEPPPPGLAARMAQLAAHALTPAPGAEASAWPEPVVAAAADELIPRPPGGDAELGAIPPSRSGASGAAQRRRGRWWLAAAAAVVVALAGVAVLVGDGGDDGTLGTLPDPGRLPARVPVGDAPWVLTWLPEGYGPVSVDGSSVVVEAPGRPVLEVRAREGEEEVEPPLVALGPMADAHIDPAAGLIRWSRQGWTLEVEASEPVPDELLRLIATTTAHADALVAPDPSGGTAAVPDVVGQDYREATEVLEDAGFDVTWGIEPIWDPSTFPGVVLRQEPGIGVEAAVGSSIVLVMAAEPTARSQAVVPFVPIYGGPGGTTAGYLAEWTMFGIGWSLPEPDPYYLNYDPDEIDVELVAEHPIVFLHGELVGYGVGEAFEPLWRAAAGTEPPPLTAPATTMIGGAGAGPGLDEPG